MASSSQAASSGVMAGRISLSDFAILIRSIPVENLSLIMQHYKDNREQIADEEYEEIMRIIQEAMGVGSSGAKPEPEKPAVESGDSSRATQVEKFRINPLQWERIKKRKAQREAYEKKFNLDSGRVRVNYKTRQDHANRRPRGKGGRFLTKEEIEELKKQSGTQDAAK